MSYKTFEIKNGCVVFADAAEKAETIKNMQAEDAYKDQIDMDIFLDSDNWGADDAEILLDNDIYFS